MASCIWTHKISNGGYFLFDNCAIPLDVRFATKMGNYSDTYVNNGECIQIGIGSYTNGKLLLATGNGFGKKLAPATTYYIYARGYLNGVFTSGTYLTTYTTPPAKPVITYTTGKNKINVSWKLEENSLWNKIYINIYKAETPNIIFKNVTLYSQEIGYKQSGNVEFVLESGNYIIKAQTIYIVDNIETPCCMNNIPDGADKYKQAAEYGTAETAYKYVSDEIRVSGFDWTYSHTDIYGNIIPGTEKIINRNEQKYFYITTNEWNALCDYVKSLIWDETAIGKSVYGYSANTTYGELVDAARVTQDEPISAKKFNMLRYCIGSHISTQGTVIAEDFESNADIYDEYFNTLKAYANKLITIKG